MNNSWKVYPLLVWSQIKDILYQILVCENSRFEKSYFKLEKKNRWSLNVVNIPISNNWRDKKEITPTISKKE